MNGGPGSGLSGDLMTHYYDYKIGRRMEWDAKQESIIALPGEDLDEILLANNERIYHGVFHTEQDLIGV